MLVLKIKCNESIKIRSVSKNECIAIAIFGINSHY